jgi:cytochrome o ubiquinol oxidase operon protein cyoD
MDQTPAQRAGAGVGSFKSYAFGFLLSIVLTTAAFALVMKGRALPRGVVMPGITAAAVAQILVHLHYFLHLDGSSAARWNWMALIFTVLIMAVFVGGTLWIMTDLNFRMM